jgi:serine/threonine-protein kinase
MIPQRHTIPAHIEAAVLTALEKLPADRFASAAEFAEALTRPTVTLPVGATHARPATISPAGWRARLKDPLVLGLAAATLASLVFAVTQLRRPPADQSLRPVRFVFTTSDSAPIVENYPWPATISPDGGTLVYAVGGSGGSLSFYSRRSDQLEGHPIPGTTGGAQPLFSPDGEWLAFEADGKEKKVRLDGSAPVTIAEGGAANGADWTTTDELVLGSSGKSHGLSRVSVAGGEMTEFTRPDSTKGELDHLWPIGLPDGRTVVFTIWNGALSTAHLATVSLDGGTVSDLGIKGIRPLAVLEGALVYVQADGAVMAVPLDRSKQRVAGRPIPVLDPIPVAAANNGNSAVFVSRGGALVTGRGANRAQLSWIGRDGVVRPISREVRDFTLPRLSPDGRRIAVLVSDGSKSDVWIQDLETGTLSRLTTVETATSAEWTRDGSRITYSAGGSDARAAIWTQPIEAASAPERLVQLAQLSPVADISPDRRWLLVQSIVENTWDVLRVATDSAHNIQPFSASSGSDLAPRVSPDGHWVALSTDESGASEVYVRSFPEPTVKVQISVGGGSGPVWSADGTRLYYVSGGAIIDARLAVGTTVRVVSRDTAFASIRSGSTGFGQANYDVSRDGSRLLMPVSQSGSYQLIVVPNWLTEFRQRMAANKKK